MLASRETEEHLTLENAILRRRSTPAFSRSQDPDQTPAGGRPGYRVVWQLMVKVRTDEPEGNEHLLNRVMPTAVDTEHTKQGTQTQRMRGHSGAPRPLRSTRRAAWRVNSITFSIGSQRRRMPATGRRVAPPGGTRHKHSGAMDPWGRVHQEAAVRTPEAVHNDQERLRVVP
jgi:hypothetical protein